jgi:hypothetical protein
MERAVEACAREGIGSPVGIEWAVEERAEIARTRPAENKVWRIARMSLSRPRGNYGFFAK